MMKEELQLLNLSDDDIDISDVYTPQGGRRKRKRKFRRKDKITDLSSTVNAKPFFNSKLILLCGSGIFSLCCLCLICYFIVVLQSRIQRITEMMMTGTKKMRKRRELDALIAHSVAKRGNGRQLNGGGLCSQDKLLSASTDDPDDYNWPRVVHHSSGCICKRKRSIFRFCNLFLTITTAILCIMLVSWLYFDLRQQIYNYREKIEEVSATSQNLPETLQNWHETSTLLMKNQSAILAQISDLQIQLKCLHENFTKLENFIDSQQNYTEVKKLVANFGARIEAVSADVENVKDHYNTITSTQNNLKNDVLKLKMNLSDIKIMATNALAVNSSDELHSFKASVENNIKALETNVTIINDTLSQKAKMLNDDLVVHKSKLDELFDHSENITSHVTSIENSWSSFRQKVSDLEGVCKNLDEEVTKNKNKVQKLDSELQEVCSKCQSSYADTINQLYHRTQSTNTASTFTTKPKDDTTSKIEKPMTSTTTTTTTTVAAASFP